MGSVKIPTRIACLPAVWRRSRHGFTRSFTVTATIIVNNPRQHVDFTQYLPAFSLIARCQINMSARVSNCCVGYHTASPAALSDSHNVGAAQENQDECTIPFRAAC
jgi:hypothetical protein